MTIDTENGKTPTPTQRVHFGSWDKAGIVATIALPVLTLCGVIWSAYTGVSGDLQGLRGDLIRVSTKLESAEAQIKEIWNELRTAKRFSP